VAVVRKGHPLAGGTADAAAYAGGRHIKVGRPGTEPGALDRSIEALGLERDVAVTVDSFAAALVLANASDLIATVPERHTGNLRAGMFTFPLPFRAPGIPVSLLWHPRLDADPAHRWLRECFVEVCRGGPAAPASPRT
jgi:DNA-binding transcriptional LysR family regulator